MKKTCVVLICLICIIVFIAGCNSGETPILNPDTDELEELRKQIEDLQVQLDAEKETITLETLAPAEPSEVITPLPSHTPLPSLTPQLTYLSPPPTPASPAMYDSKALFVSFNVSTGIAQFDYIDILQGDAAVQYMVSHQGKSLQEAQDIVDNWADSECIVKNDNPQLRSINMNGPAITMLWYPDGSEDYSLNGVSFNFQDFVDLYTQHPDKVDWYLFYSIDVDSSGDVLEVEQVYWP